MEESLGKIGGIKKIERVLHVEWNFWMLISGKQKSTTWRAYSASCWIFLHTFSIHTEKSFRHLIESNRNQIVFTIFRSNQIVFTIYHPAELSFCNFTGFLSVLRLWHQPPPEHKNAFLLPWIHPIQCG